MNDKKNGTNRWIIVQAYKHDGSLHRQWSPAFLVEENDDYWILSSRSSLITESDGRRWLTKENAVFILFKKKWMNVLCMFKEGGGICYYANIASPTILDDGFLRYIDYDLDLKLYPDKVIKALDEQEFISNAKSYGYPDDLIDAIRHSFAKTRSLMEQKKFPFNDEDIISLHKRFLSETIPFVPKASFRHY